MITLLFTLISGLFLFLLEPPLSYASFILAIFFMIFLYLVIESRDYILVLKFDFTGVKIHSILLISFSSLLLLSDLGLVHLDSLFLLIISIFTVYYISGYVISSIAGFSRYFSILENVVFSYLLGFAFSALLAYLFHFLMNIHEWSTLVLMVYICLGVLLLFIECKQGSSMENKLFLQTISLSVDELALFILILSFFVAAVLSTWQVIYIASTDMIRHYANSLILLRDPSTYTAFPYLFFHLSQALVLKLSFAQLIPFLITMNMLNFLLPISFFVMSKKYFEKLDKRAPIISTLFFFLFYGFAWIYLIKNKLARPEVSEYRLLSQVYGQTFSMTGYAAAFYYLGYLPISVGLTIFIMLLYLLRRSDIPKQQFLGLCFLLVYLGYMVHIAEMVIFSVVIAAFSLLSSEKNRPLEWILLSLPLASFASLITFLTLIWKCSFTFFTPSSLISYSIAGVLGLMAYFLHIKIAINKSFTHTYLTQFFRIYGFSIFLLLAVIYTLGLLAWWSVAEEFDVSLVQETFQVPWFFYPVILGIKGIFALVGVYFVLRHPEKYGCLWIIVVMAFVSFIFGRMVSFVNVNLFNTGYFELRFLTFIGMAASMLGVIPLIHSQPSNKETNERRGSLGVEASRNISKFKVRRSITVSPLIALLVVCGLTSTVLGVQYWSFNAQNKDLKIDQNELSVMGFLSELFKNDSRSRVLTPTSVSRERLSFSAPALVPQSSSQVLFNAESPEVALYLATGGTQDFSNYIYLHQRDLKFLSEKCSESYFVKHMVKTLPMIYNTSFAKVYKVPRQSFPLSDSTTVLVLPGEYYPLQKEDIFFIYDLLSRALWNYTVSYATEDISNYKLVILPFDPYIMESTRNITFQDLLQYISTRYFDYVRSGGKLLIINTNGYGLFYVSEKCINAIKIHGNGELPIPETKVPIFNISIPNVYVYSFYSDIKGNKVPLSLRYNIGEGEIMYLNIYPLLSTLKENKEGSGQAVYSTVEKLLDVAGITNLSPFRNFSYNFKALFKELIASGNISLITSSLYIPSGISTNYMSIIAEQQNITLANVTLISISNYGKLMLTINNMTIRSPGRGLYSSLLVNGKLMFTLQKTGISPFEIIYVSENKFKIVKVNESTVTISMYIPSPSEILVKNPSIMVNGNAFIKNIWIYDLLLLWHLRLYGQNLKVKGFLVTEIKYSDVYSLACEILINGTTLRDPPITSYDEWKTLPTTIFCFIILVPVLLLIPLLRKKTIRTRKCIKIKIKIKIKRWD